MKYLVYILLVLITINTVFAQDDLGNNDFIVTTDPSSVIQSNGNTRAFPWDGCQSFEITVNLEIFEITTNVIVCCVQGVCLPQPEEIRGELQSANEAIIRTSSTATINGKRISILPGKYRINEDGIFQNLKYRISK